MTKWYLKAAQAEAWESVLKAQLEAAGVTRKEVIERMDRPANFKAELSKFMGGTDEEVLRRWLFTAAARNGTPFAEAIGWRLDDLLAALARVRGADAQTLDERRRWHPAFPAIFEEEAAIPAAMERVGDPERLGTDDGERTRRARVCGPRDLGLRLAAAELQATKGEPGERTYTNVVMEEIHESETPRRAEKGEDVFVLRPWGPSQVFEVIRRLLGDAPPAGVRSKTAAAPEAKESKPRRLVSDEQAENLHDLASRLKTQPSLLGGLRRPGEIIAWLGRAAAGRKIDDPIQAREAALASEEREWLEGPAGPMLSALGIPAIEAILVAGWAADACSRPEWQDALAGCQPQASGFWFTPDAAQTLIGNKKSLRPDLLETLVGLRTPSSLLDALITGRVLTVVDGGMRLVPARMSTFAMRLGRAIAGHPDGSRFWLAHAMNASALEILREAAQAGLEWTHLRLALRSAAPALQVDACRAAIAFAAYTQQPKEVTVDDEFVRWWAGATWAALWGVHCPDDPSEARYVALGWRFEKPCVLLPAELDLAGLPEAIADSLPFLFPGDVPSGLVARCPAEVVAAAGRWRAAMSRFMDNGRVTADSMYLAVSRLAPASVVPIFGDVWQLDRWSHIERRAERDPQLRKWLCEPDDKPPVPFVPTDPNDVLPIFEGPEHATSAPHPPPSIRVRWIPRGEDRGEAALDRWLRAFERVQGRDSGVPDETEIDRLVEGLRAFDEGAVSRLISDAIFERGHLLGKTDRRFVLAVAQRLGHVRLAVVVSSELRTYFTRRFAVRFMGTLQEGGLDRFHSGVEADLKFGVAAAAAAFRMGAPEELRNWAHVGPELTLPEWHAKLHHRWTVLEEARRPGFSTERTPAPPPEMCSRQLDDWIPMDRGPSLLMPYGLGKAIAESRRLQDIAPVTVLLEFAHIHDESRRQIRVPRSGGGKHEMSRAEQAVGELAELGLRDAAEPLDVALFRIALTARPFHNKLREEILKWADSVVFERETTVWSALAEKMRHVALETLFREGDGPLDEEVLAALEGREPTVRGDELRRRLRDEGFKECARRLLQRAKSDRVRRELRQQLGLPEPKEAQQARDRSDLTRYADATRDQRLFLACRERLDVSPESRALLARLADEARDNGQLIEALYFELRCGRPVADLVRRTLELPDIESLDDDFRLVVRNRRPESVTGGFVTLLRLAKSHATDTQIERLVCTLAMLPPPGKHFDEERFEAGDYEEKLPTPFPQPGDDTLLRRANAVTALTERLGPRESMALGRERLFQLYLQDLWKQQAPLDEIWALLEEVRSEPAAAGRLGPRVYSEGSACIEALTARDLERFLATVQSWLEAPDIDSIFARELTRRVLRHRPDLGVELLGKLMNHPMEENRDWARLWAADAGPTLPHGGFLLRQITSGD